MLTFAVKAARAINAQSAVLRYLKYEDALTAGTTISLVSYLRAIALPKTSVPRFDLTFYYLMSYVESGRRLRSNVKNFSLPGQEFELGSLESCRS